MTRFSAGQHVVVRWANDPDHTDHLGMVIDHHVEPVTYAVSPIVMLSDGTRHIMVPGSAPVTNRHYSKAAKTPCAILPAPHNFLTAGAENEALAMAKDAKERWETINNGMDATGSVAALTDAIAWARVALSLRVIQLRGDLPDESNERDELMQVIEGGSIYDLHGAMESFL